MSVETFNPEQITATPEAQRHIKAQIEQAGASFLRLGVKESGCNGFMYTLDYIDAPEENDLAVDLGEALRVYVARAELHLVAGTEVDYVREGLNATLQFKNANAQSYCGCGESFSIAS